MTILRVSAVLVGAAVVLLTVVMLRAETTRLHYSISRLDARADELRQQIRDRGVELQRLRDPARIRFQAELLRTGEIELGPQGG